MIPDQRYITKSNTTNTNILFKLLKKTIITIHFKIIENSNNHFLVRYDRFQSSLLYSINCISIVTILIIN